MDPPDKPTAIRTYRSPYQHYITYKGEEIRFDGTPVPSDDLANRAVEVNGQKLPFVTPAAVNVHQAESHGPAVWIHIQIRSEDHPEKDRHHTLALHPHNARRLVERIQAALDEIDNI